MLFRSVNGKFQLQQLVDRPWKCDLLFVALLVSFYFIYQYGVMLKVGPSGLHTWRQADCTSIIDNYYSHGMHFLQPEIHYQMSDDQTSGYTAGEFPGLYYLNAALWKVFGKSVGLTRMVNLLITFLGLFALYRAYLLWSGSTFWSMVCALLLLTTPVIGEYGFNFLTDVPGFAFALMGWYFFSKFYHDPKNKWLLYSALLFMMGGLLKVSALIVFVAMLGLWFFELLGIRFKEDGNRVFAQPWKQLGMLAITIIGVMSWYLYADHYNDLHGGRYTFNSVWPIWTLSGERITELIDGFWWWVSPFTLPVLYWYLIPVALVGWIFVWRKTPRAVRFFSVLSLLGVLGYLALWFQSIDQHDYYFANACILLVFLPLPFITAKLNVSRTFATVMMVLGVELVAYGAMYTRQNLELRHYHEEEYNYPLMPIKPAGLMKWYNWERETRIRGLRTIEPVLEQLGIDTSKKVVIMPDPTINHTLYMADRKGWTSFGDDTYLNRTQHSFVHGAEYLLVLHPDVYREQGMETAKQHILTTHKNVDIIDLEGFAAEWK